MKPAVNKEGVLHVHISEKQPEAAELARHLEAMRSTNTQSHQMDEPVFNPAVSKAQARAMYAAAEGHSTLGIPVRVGKEFTKGFHGHKGSIKELPSRAKKHR